MEVDLAGFVIDDARRKSSKPWNIPSDTTIAPRSYLLLPSSITRISLNNEGETLHLSAPDGTLLSRVRYPVLQRGEAFALSSDESWCVTTTPTPGVENHCNPPEGENEKRPSHRQTGLADVGMSKRETERVRSKALPLTTLTRTILQGRTTASPREVRPELLRNLRDQVIRPDLPPHLTETGGMEEQGKNAACLTWNYITDHAPTSSETLGRIPISRVGRASSRRGPSGGASRFAENLLSGRSKRSRMQGAREIDERRRTCVVGCSR